MDKFNLHENVNLGIQIIKKDNKVYYNVSDILNDFKDIHDNSIILKDYRHHFRRLLIVQHTVDNTYYAVSVVGEKEKDYNEIVIVEIMEDDINELWEDSLKEIESERNMTIREWLDKRKEEDETDLDKEVLIS